MRIPPDSPGRNQSVWFSPLLLTVALSPVFLQTSTPLSCKSGDTTLSEFQVFVQGQDRIVGFDPNQRDYSVSLPLGTDEARVRSVTTDPAAQVWVDVLIGTERFRYLNGAVGGSDLVVPLPPGPSALQVWVRAPKAASDYYDVAIQVGNGTDFCFEQPVDCSASGECLTDGICDPMCDPIDAANGLCDRCSGQDLALSDGTPCSVGVCGNGACVSCPTLTKVGITPLQANVGDDIDVSAQASGTGTIDYQWTATAGSFAAPTSPITTYRCEEVGQQDLTITVSDGTGSCTDEYTVTVTCEVDQTFACTEQGIRDAIAAGGGPHTFACNGPTTVTTLAEIIIDNDVILDGEDNLTIDGNDDHRVLSVVPGATAELIALTVTGGALDPDGGQGAGILNEGILTITDSSITSNGSSCGSCGVDGGGIYNSGVLTLESSTVQGNEANYGCGLSNIGTATLIKTSVSQNGRALPSSSWVYAGSGILSTGTLTLIDSVVSLNHDGRGDASALSTYATATLINSLVSDNYSTQSAAVSCGGSTTLINSTVSGNTGLMTSGFECRGTLRLINSTVVALGTSFAIRFRSEPGELIAANSIIIGGFPWQQRLVACSFENIGAIATSQGGNVESPGDTCGFTDPTDLVNISAADLGLGPLADHGGPTFTHALLPGSVAIDRIPEAMCLDEQGQPLTTDQRGQPRPGGTMCDVGAYEVQP